jgi:ABC-type Fe3+ transport system substrate-binding protein
VAVATPFLCSRLKKEFIKLVLSKQCQEVVIKDGYIPLPEKVMEKSNEALNNSFMNSLQIFINTGKR